MTLSSSCRTLQDVRAANVKALTAGALLALHREDFDNLLGSLSHIRHMWRFEALRKVRAALRINPKPKALNLAAASAHHSRAS